MATAAIADNTIDFIEIIVNGVNVLIFGTNIEKSGNGILDYLMRILSWDGGLGWFAGFSISILMLLVIIEAIKAAVDAVRGDGFKVDKKVMTLLMLIAILATYKPLATVLWEQNVHLSKKVSGNFKALTKSVDVILDKVKMDRKTKALTHNINAWRFHGTALGWYHAVSGLVNDHVPSLTEIFTFIILVLLKILISVKVAGAFVSLGVVLMVGPFFIPWFLSEDFKSITTQWFSNILVYFLEIQIMMFVINLANYVATMGIELYLSRIVGYITIDNLFLMIVFPAFTVAIVFSVSRMTRTLFSSVIGGAEDAAPGMVGAAAGAGLKGVMMSAGLMKGAIGKIMNKPNTQRRPWVSKVSSSFKSMSQSRTASKQIKKNQDRLFGGKK